MSLVHYMKILAVCVIAFHLRLSLSRRVTDAVIPPCGHYCHQQTIAPLHRKVKQVESTLVRSNIQVDEIGDAVEELINGVGESLQ